MCSKQLVETPVFVTTKEDVLKAEQLYKRDQYLTFTCQKCGKSQKRKVSKFRVQNYQFYCANCQKGINTAKTCLERYGVKNPGMLKSTQDKMKQTCLERYGKEHYNNRNKCKQTIKNTYGVENVSQLEEVKKKKENTFQAHFGESNVFKTSYFDQKRKETSNQKYGTDFPSQSDVVKQRQAQTNFTKWGYKSTSQNPSIRQKLSKKIKASCDTRTPEQWKQMRQKAIKTYKYGNELFDSSWELALYLYAGDHNISIEREPAQLVYEFQGKKHFYYPDFKYNGKFLELKGPQFFNENGILINPWDRSQDALYAAKWDFMKKIGVEVWSTKEMQPILDYINQKYTKDFIKLFEVNLPFPYPTLSTKGDFDIIRFFHKSLYEASCKGHKSPLQAWQDKDLIKTAALNRLKYVGSCKPNDVLRGLTLSTAAPKVSIFKPSLAEQLVKTYLKTANSIVDPFSGFSGRLVGVTNCGKNYIGKDINEKHVKESNQIIQFKGIQSGTVVVEDLLSKLGAEHYDALFTCPPYGGKEHWNENNDEVEKTCDEWIDLCLQHYDCKQYLFVVDETEKYKDNVVQKLEKKTIWKGKAELVILIEKL